MVTMNSVKKILIKLIFFITFSNIRCEDNSIDLTFPDDFLFGTSTSAYQVEGAWNHSDKSENIWDYFTHNFPNKIKDHSNADISCDSYHKYKEDVRLIKDIGFDHYRFSLSWSRILPTGFTNNISQTGVEYYHNLIDELIKHNIEPIVTIYHFDHPQSLEEKGGWLNDDMVYWYADYARFVFQEFGHKIKYFSTMNEISIMCRFGYGNGMYAPGLALPGYGAYKCAHNMLKGHALAYRIYDQEFRKNQKGQIGITEICHYDYNKDENGDDATKVSFAFNCGWIFNPIFSNDGNYPEIMIRRVEERSQLQGLNQSRLPTFSKKWIDYLRGSSDFMGLNHYTSRIVENLPKEEQLNWPDDSGIKISFDPNWPSTAIFTFKVVPQGFGDLLRKLKVEYNNPPIYIFESGVSPPRGDESFREEYFYSYLKEMLIAIKRDQCKVKMYTVWSFMDSFEWANGYSHQFGLIKVDFNDKDKKRTMKSSVPWFKSMLEKRTLIPPMHKITNFNLPCMK